MSSIILSGITWSTPAGRVLFSDLDLNFGCERVGLVGRNGVGKTMLLKIISGEVQPLTGNVSLGGTLGVLNQTVQVGPQETLADLFHISDSLAILRRAEKEEASIEELAEADWTLEERLVAALAKMGLAANPDALLLSMSGGERTRASLASAIFAEPDFLLLDEPTNNLDRFGREAVISMLAGWRAGAIIVSHDRELLEHVDAIIELTSLGAVRYGGNWDRYREQKDVEVRVAEQDLAHAERKVAEINRKAQITAERRDRREAAGARKSARGGLPRILLGARKNSAESSRGAGVKLAEQQKEKALETAAAARARIELHQRISVTLPPTGLAASRSVFALKSVSAGYDTVCPLVTNLSLSLVGPERVAVTGSNGSGKTTLIKVITGQLRPFSGEVSVTVDFSALDQRVSMLDPDLSIFDNFLRLNPSSTENACRSALANFMFRADAALQLVGTLSGGQILRAGLACVLGGPNLPKLLILDEPTNHLDIESVQSIERGLVAYDGALLVVSHDETFLENIGVQRRVELLEGTICCRQ